MAGVYIKNMEMPEKCEDCRFWDGQNNGCPIVHMITLRRTHQKKPDWCPLVEVPDHGDLIDRDEMLEKASLCVSDFGTPDERWRPDRDWFLGINAMPTVIPADKEEV